MKHSLQKLGMILGFLLLSSCASKGFPKHWWKSDPSQPAASWEILPEAAEEGEVILSKRNELGLLSNFAPTPFEYRGKKFASVEGFWQAMKFPEGPSDPRLKIKK